MTLRVGFLAVLGGAHSWQAVPLVPVNVASGMAVTCGAAAFAARQRTSGNLLAWQRFGVVPTMLFAGVYFPVSGVPAAAQVVSTRTPRPSETSSWCGWVMVSDRTAAASTK